MKTILFITRVFYFSFTYISCEITKYFAVCPGGEGADLKSVGLKGLAGSNPVYSVYILPI